MRRVRSVLLAGVLLLVSCTPPDRGARSAAADDRPRQSALQQLALAEDKLFLGDLDAAVKAGLHAGRALAARGDQAAGRAYLVAWNALQAEGRPLDALAAEIEGLASPPPIAHALLWSRRAELALRPEAARDALTRSDAALRNAQAASTSAVDRGLAAILAGSNALLRGDLEESRAQLERARSELERDPDPRWRGQAMLGLAHLALREGRLDAAEKMFGQAALSFQTAGAPFFVAMARFQQGETSFALQLYGEAAKRHAEAEVMLLAMRRISLAVQSCLEEVRDVHASTPYGAVRPKPAIRCAEMARRIAYPEERARLLNLAAAQIALQTELLHGLRRVHELSVSQTPDPHFAPVPLDAEEQHELSFALTALAEALRAPPGSLTSSGVAIARAWQAQIARRMGRNEEALAGADALLRAADPELLPPFMRPMLLEVAGVALAAQGKLDDASGVFKHLGDERKYEAEQVLAAAGGEPDEAARSASTTARNQAGDAYNEAARLAELAAGVPLRGALARGAPDAAEREMLERALRLRSTALSLGDTYARLQAAHALVRLHAWTGDHEQLAEATSDYVTSWAKNKSTAKLIRALPTPLELLGPVRELLPPRAVGSRARVECLRGERLALRDRKGDRADDERAFDREPRPGELDAEVVGAFTACASLARKAGDAPTLANAELRLGRLYGSAGDLKKAEAPLRASLDAAWPGRLAIGEEAGNLLASLLEKRGAVLEQARVERRVAYIKLARGERGFAGIQLALAAQRAATAAKHDSRDVYEPAIDAADILLGEQQIKGSLAALTLAASTLPSASRAHIAKLLGCMVSASEEAKTACGAMGLHLVRSYKAAAEGSWEAASRSVSDAAAIAATTGELAHARPAIFEHALRVHARRGDRAAYLRFLARLAAPGLEVNADDVSALAVLEGELPALLKDREGTARLFAALERWLPPDKADPASLAWPPRP